MQQKDSLVRGQMGFGGAPDMPSMKQSCLAVDETVILLTPPVYPY